MKPPFVVLLITLLTLCAIAQTANQSTDQATVQQAYAKAAYALQLTAVYDLYPSGKDYALGKQVSAADVQAALDVATVTFMLGNFKTGSISEIANAGIFDLTGTPFHPKLGIYLGTVNYEKNCDAASKAQGFACRKGSQLMAHARWEPSPVAIVTPLDVPLAEVLKLSGFATDYTRYVTYTVRMHYQGQDATYSALALFGGSGKPLILDRYADRIRDFVNEEVYPSALLAGMKESRSVPQPAITDWIRNMPTDPTSQPGKAVCNPTTMKCGIAPSDLQPYQSSHPIQVIQPPYYGPTCSSQS